MIGELAGSAPELSTLVAAVKAANLTDVLSLPGPIDVFAPTNDAFGALLASLSISAETLYIRAGILDEPTGEIDPIGEIRRDPRLLEEQKKTLVHIYESFLEANGADDDGE